MSMHASTSVPTPSPDRSTARAYPQIVLFGDSITEASEGTFAAAMRQEYVRKAEIISRGFSGYTAKLALDVLPKWFSTLGQGRVHVMTVFFGANDACLPGNAQHVPLGEYIACVKAIVQHDLLEKQDTKVVLIIPAPVDEYQLNGDQRTAANTKRYADACRQTGKELDVPIVDLWSIFMKHAGWEEGNPLAGSRESEENAVLKTLLSDGLHFTPRAYSIMFQELMKVIREKLPEEGSDRMPMVFPAWSDLLVECQGTNRE